ncbi:MAG: serpin family protein, partial [Planctomycetota bacterium]
ASLWGETSVAWSRESLGLLNRYHGPAFREVDFERATEHAREEIDAWAAAARGGRIRRISGSVGPLDAIAIATAAYFRGRWAEEFEPGSTRPGTFRVSSRRSVEVPLMSQTELHPYLERATFQVLELAYRDGPFSMVIFLPKGVNGLRGLERELTSERVESWLGALETRLVEVHLPRFRVEASFDLSRALRDLGAATVFSTSADLSGFSLDLAPQGRGCYLRCAEHRAVVSVDEEGTEAAAVDSEIVTFYGGLSRPVVFRADHPFIFLIRHRTTRAILFLGRLVDPTPSNTGDRREVQPSRKRSRIRPDHPRRRVPE